jgi:hypothetical protein
MKANMSLVTTQRSEFQGNCRNYTLVVAVLFLETRRKHKDTIDAFKDCGGVQQFFLEANISCCDCSSVSN